MPKAKAMPTEVAETLKLVRALKLGVLVQVGLSVTVGPVAETLKLVRALKLCFVPKLEDIPMVAETLKLVRALKRSAQSSSPCPLTHSSRDPKAR